MPGVFFKLNRFPGTALPGFPGCNEGQLVPGNKIPLGIGGFFLKNLSKKP
jgi:hypothetical protein